MRTGIAIRALLVGALMLGANAAEAIIIYDFSGSVGVVAGLQAARINVVRLTGGAEDSRLPCPVSIGFIDSAGKVIGDPNTRTFTESGQTVSANFLGGPDTKPGTRVQVRGQVSIGDPGIFPGCRGTFAATLEIVNRSTGRTEIVLPFIEQ
jgi:hypothetical protein